MRSPPVALFIFNRPDCVRPTLAAIRAAKPAVLLIVADGPRAGRSTDITACAAARAAVDEGIDWPCDVRRHYSEANLGLANRVSSGIDWVFSQVPEAIILEDDCVADSSFFPFCAELLERYRDEPRVGQISGCSFQEHVPTTGPSYYFSRYPHCWGWATWRRAWQAYDHAMKGWPSSDGHEWLSTWIEHPDERAIWIDRLNATAARQIDSWAYRWTLALWRQKVLTALPYRNLVSNIGFGDHATNTRSANSVAVRPRSTMPFPLVHPAKIERDVAADDYTSQLLFRPASWPTRVRRRLNVWLQR